MLNAFMLVADHVFFVLENFSTTFLDIEFDVLRIFHILLGFFIFLELNIIFGNF